MCAKKLQRGMLSIIPTLQVLYRFRKRGMSLNFFYLKIIKVTKTTLNRVCMWMCMRLIVTHGFKCMIMLYLYVYLTLFPTKRLYKWQGYFKYLDILQKENVHFPSLLYLIFIQTLLLPTTNLEYEFITKKYCCEISIVL